jgi:IPT/TIG domain-containing protein
MSAGARMRRSIAVAGAATLLLGGAAATGAGPLRILDAAAAFCPQPSFTANPVSPVHALKGSTVTISGSNLSASGTLCTNPQLTIHVGNTSFQPSGGGSATSQSFTLSQPADGTVSVSYGDGTSATSNAVFVTDPPPLTAMLPAAPREGMALSATGSGLDLGGQLTGAAVSWKTLAGTCPASPATIGASGTTVSLPALTTYCEGTAYLTLSWSQGSLPQISLGSVDVAPTVSSLSPAEAPAGSTVTVKGTGFGTAGSARVGGVSASSSWTDTAVTVTVPDAGSGGAVAVTRADGVTMNPGSVTEDARIDSISPASAAPGAAVTVSGGGFGSSTGFLSLGSMQLTPSSWSSTSITFTVPPGAQSGAITVTPPSGAAATHQFSVSAALSGVSPGHGPVGTLVQLAGTGFGASQGTVTVGGRSAAVSLWGDTQVVAQIPSGLSPGSATIGVQPPGQNAVTIGFTVDPGAAPAGTAPGPTTGGGGSSSSSSSSGGSSAAGSIPSFIAPSADGPIISTSPVQFQKPPAPSGPVTLTLNSPSEAGDPGQDVPLSVTLVAFGKPVSGAKVDFVLVVEPGRDAAITPAEAVTDAAGHAAATLHLSSTAGDHIVLARSGQYSDEVRVAVKGAGDGPVAAIGGAGQRTDVIATVSTGPPKALIVGGLVACVLLFLAGFAIQVLVPRSRRSRAVVAVGPQAAVAASRRGSLRIPPPFAVAERFATLVQFAGTVAFVAAALPAARLLQRLTGRR